MSKVVMRLWMLDPSMGYLPPLTRKAKYDAMAARINEMTRGEDPQLGLYLKSYNPDGNFGAGAWEFTDNKNEARVFADHIEAHECWRAVSKVVPRRIDGKPNRPLTQFNVTFEPAP